MQCPNCLTGKLQETGPHSGVEHALCLRNSNLRYALCNWNARCTPAERHSGNYSEQSRYNNTVRGTEDKLSLLSLIIYKDSLIYLVNIKPLLELFAPF